MYKNIVFWLDIPLFHVSPLISSVANSNVNVIVICENNMPQWRLDMGFPIPNFGNAKVYNEPSSVVRHEVLHEYSGSDSVHIFHGLRGTKENFKCFKWLVGNACSVGLYFEPIKLYKTIKGFLRGFYYRLFFARYSNRIDFMLALGDFGKCQYVSLGLPENKVISFGYFIDGEYIAPLNPSSRAASPIVKILYAGQLIDRKNVLMLASSFRNIEKNYDNVALAMVGEGELKKLLIDYVQSEGLVDKVCLLGYSSNHELKEIFSNHDIFVLPSKFDGWGVVAVEALARGLPIIVSDKCGSASILKNPKHGIVFDSTSEQALTNALRLMIEDHEYYFSSESRKERLNYAREHLSADAGKNKLLQILNGKFIEKTTEYEV